VFFELRALRLYLKVRQADAQTSTRQVTMLTSRHPASEANIVADMPEVHGFCDDRLRSVGEAFQQNFLDGLEVGASLCVTYRDERVLDLWAGQRDPQRGIWTALSEVMPMLGRD